MMKAMNGSPITILAIDADATAAAHTTSILQAAGYACRVAASLCSALEVLRGTVPDLILCDVNLAGHSGTAVCNELRHSDGLDEVPLMFLSAAQSPDIIRRSNACGGTYYLRKPFDSKVLVELVEKALLVPHYSA
jgi:DNA-binding response OmpR family regulator